jgi:cell division septation protein DedD
MSSPTAAQERRQSPRAKIEPLAYISLEPDNGGIVLNVSEGGLCFHCTAPVQKDGTIHFWFSRQQHRIEGDAELAWMDPSRKRGGLRFTSLPPESRTQLRTWIDEPVLLPPPKQHPQTLLSSPPDFGALTVPPEVIAVASVRTQPAKPAPVGFAGFAKGLMTGIVASALVAGIFVIHSYRRDIGESLIRLGERLAPRSSPQPPPVPPPTTSSAPVKFDSTVPPLPLPAAEPPSLALNSTTNSAKPAPADSEPAAQAVPLEVAKPRKANAPASVPIAPKLPLPSTGAAKLPIFAGLHAEVTKVETAPSGTENSSQPTEPVASKMYFDVGKFKQQPQAQSAADRLAQLGFPAAVVQKKNLWTNSYQVTVGPYAYDEKAEAAHQQLLSRGFPARAVERGSHGLVLRPGLSLNRTAMPAGNYNIVWESYVTHAKVKFMQHDTVVTAAEAKWVKSDVTYDNNAVVYKINDDGSRSLLQILFAGMDRALVFQ